MIIVINIMRHYVKLLLISTGKGSENRFSTNKDLFFDPMKQR